MSDPIHDDVSEQGTSGARRGPSGRRSRIAFRRPGAGRGLRLVTAFALSAAAVVAAVSCQSKSGDGNGGDPAVTTVTLKVPTTGPGLDADGNDLNGRPMVKWVRNLGFSFAQTPEQKVDGKVVDGLNATCVSCHTSYKRSESGDSVAKAAFENRTMHDNDVGISCIDCHGGFTKDTTDAARANDLRDLPEDASNERGSAAYEKWTLASHVTPRKPELWWMDADGNPRADRSANPEITAARSLTESNDFIRFINPGDFRAAMVTCAPCHRDQVESNRSNMMTHGAMLWSAALYNNGAVNRKRPVFGEFYAPNPKDPSTYVQAGMMQDPLPTVRESDRYGILSALYPLPRWEITQPGNVLRVFERGGLEKPEMGNALPLSKELPGKPEVKLSPRGFGTDLRTDPVVIGLQKTRLFDPTLNFMGSNDHPGDYRASGCSGCHVVYGNDRSAVQSSLFARYGHKGQSFSTDPTVYAKGEAPATQPAAGSQWTDSSDRSRGHPVKHMMVQQMPTSSCIVCHIHPGTNVVMSYLGTLWWDNESDGKFMYPSDQKYPTGDDDVKVTQHNPEGSAVRGLWSDMYAGSTDHAGERAGPDFLDKVGSPEFNAKLTRTQLADFHGHGWVYRGVYKQDKHGNMLDHAGDVVTATGPELTKRMGEAMKFQVALPERDASDDAKNKENRDKNHPPAGTPVHLKDIHLERGMQCVDCHFQDDNHGSGKLYGETRNAVTIECVDCHGSIEEPSKIVQYLSQDDKDTPKAKALLAGALSGNARRHLIDDRTPAVRDELLKRNAKVISDHFETDLADGPNGAKLLIQKSAMSKVADAVGLTDDPAAQVKNWVVVQTHDTTLDGYVPTGAADPKGKELAAYAHSVKRFTSGKPVEIQWGGDTKPEATKAADGGSTLAHSSKTMSCYACHSSWNTSCFGCHLPQRANQKKFMLHNDAIETRNYTNYNYQTLRDDVYMLGVDSTSKDHKIVPVRSACAVLVSSQDALRQWIYTQQQTISAEGYSGQSFSPYFPHTVRSAETKLCADCHVHKDKEGRVDNNATTAQLLMQGTNAFNFIGRFAWVAEEDEGLEAVVVAERDEPQAVIGSTLHELAYPDWNKQHVANGRKLTTAHHHHGTVYDVQLRGEYLYAACGEDGFIAYDVANVDNKGFSERILTAPFSPLGQRFYVKSKFATSICSPSTLAIDPTRAPLVEKQELTNGTVREHMPNEEGKITEIGNPDKVLVEHKPISLFFAFLYLTDREEGLIVVGNPLDEKKNKPGVATLLDGDPQNNFLERAVTFNPNGILKGARSMTVYGMTGFICCDAGIVAVDLSNPLEPRVIDTPGLAGLNNPKKVEFQFRYGFVADDDGVKVIDMTFPDRPQLITKPGASVAIPGARNIYLARTWAFVSAGEHGVQILDIERPETPRLLGANETGGDFNAEAGIKDAHAARFGMTNASMFLYVADGEHGLKVLQLTSPEYTPTYLGFAPKITPKLVAWYPTKGPAVAISEGLDRDRAVDEAGNQLSVFGRKGARPFTREEQQRLYMRTIDGRPEVWYVSNEPPANGRTALVKPSGGAAAEPAPTPPPAGGPRRGGPRRGSE